MRGVDEGVGGSRRGWPWRSRIGTARSRCRAVGRRRSARCDRNGGRSGVTVAGSHPKPLGRRPDPPAWRGATEGRRSAGRVPWSAPDRDPGLHRLRQRRGWPRRFSTSSTCATRRRRRDRRAVLRAPSSGRRPPISASPARGSVAFRVTGRRYGLARAAWRQPRCRCGPHQ